MDYIDSTKEVKQETSDKGFYKLSPSIFDVCQIVIQKKWLWKGPFRKY